MGSEEAREDGGRVVKPVDISWLTKALEEEANRPRATEIWKQPCANCPSAHFPTDPEVEDIKTWSREAQLDTVFRCAWRPEKLCKGYCDVLQITEKDLKR